MPQAHNVYYTVRRIPNQVEKVGEILNAISALQCTDTTFKKQPHKFSSSAE